MTKVDTVAQPPSGIEHESVQLSFDPGAVGTDVLRCPCGGRRTIRALHSTRKAAEERLTALGITLPSRALPPATAPPQLAFAV
jgi:hypothetical protein